MRSALKPGDMVATTEMKVNFIAPGEGELEARARVLQIGGLTAVGEVEVFGENGTRLGPFRPAPAPLRRWIPTLTDLMRSERGMAPENQNEAPLRGASVC